ncbi:flagellar biosynthesis protein FlhF [Thalassomonas actiniarum]|uniref:Flagellar biosynthesis protein FlhF n=1 Tax=Thalassomonas actiniarum TaxID=485447 RepID=A0AAE9YUB8_9GAMM|nr:flagellar biosynthesis protein FlhF [Thalassomonas actiniarum]WDE00504.1 flagellar biosynthesis protein FlhF [Thalassomonas actiniarum]
MKIRRFVAKDMRTALTQIKEELGADAVIMSNKKIPEGVELMAAVDYNQVVPEARNEEAEVASGNPAAALPPSANGRAMENDVVMLGQQKAAAIQNAMAQQGIPQTAMPQGATAPANTDTVSVPADSLSALLQRQAQSNANTAAQTPQATVAQTPSRQQEAPLGSIEEQFKNFTQRLEQSSVAADDNNLARNNGQENAGQENDMFAEMDNGFDSQTQASTLSSAAMNSHGGAVAQQDFDNMKKEMASIRQLLEHQVSGLMWQDMAQKDPSRALLVSRLKALGVTEQLADQIAGYVPANVNEEDAWEQACELMTRQINTTNNDIIHRGGVVALVGPTGVGKTTTVAKLAARFAQIHGAEQVAMISTDTYRIGGYEQLATYGRIIGCQVKQAKDAQALDALIQQFGKKKLILIDTAGMGQRDMRLAQHLTTLIANARVRIRNYLVLGANAQQRVMQENVERFKKVPLSGCIYTKLDESLSIGEIISTSIQNGLPISYLTDGQRVPEDIKVANAEKLVTLADKMANKVAGNNPGGWQSVSMNPAAVV